MVRKMSRRSLIYVLRCLPTNKAYVGKTIQGKRRPLSHPRELDKGIHDNSYLQRAWNKYGSKNFKCYAVEECEASELIERERWWVGFLRTADRRYGFNLCYPVADGDQEVRSQLSLCQIEKWRDPVIRLKRLTGLRVLHKDPEWKSDRGRALAMKWADPEWRKKMLKVLSANVDKLQDRMKNEPGFKAHRMRGIQPVKS